MRILLGRQLGLHFTLKLSGMSLFLGFDLDFERKLLAHIRKTVASARLARLARLLPRLPCCRRSVTSASSAHALAQQRRRRSSWRFTHPCAGAACCLLPPCSLPRHH